MSTFKERLVVEQDQLADKINGLDTFLKNKEASSKLDPIQLDLLNIQLPTMMTYYKILKMRMTFIELEEATNIKHPDLTRGTEENNLKTEE